jgi:ketosteroid isomerase-like protein
MSITTQEVLLFGGGYGLARGIYTWTWTPKDGGAKADYDGKFMTLFKKQANGSWKIYRDSFNSNLPPK